MRRGIADRANSDPGKIVLIAADHVAADHGKIHRIATLDYKTGRSANLSALWLREEFWVLGQSVGN